MTFWPNPSLNLLKRLCIKGKQIGRDLLNPSLFPPFSLPSSLGEMMGVITGLKRDQKGRVYGRDGFLETTLNKGLLVKIGRDCH